MKSTGIIRNIDSYGRICIPKELRREIGLKDGHEVELYIIKGGLALIPIESELDKEKTELITNAILAYKEVEKKFENEEEFSTNELIDWVKNFYKQAK